MKIFNRQSVGCPTCQGAGVVIMNAFVMSKGKQLVSKRCPSCSGRGTLRRH